MKKLILLTGAFIFCISIVRGQITKGSVFLGGGIDFNNIKEEKINKEDHFISVTPSVGVAIKQNTILGIELFYSHSKYEINSYTPQLNDAYGVAVFARKYMPLGKKFYLFGETSVYYLNNKYTSTYPTYKTEQKVWGTGINIFPGLSYAVSKRFHLEASLPRLADLGYTKTKTISNGATTEKGSLIGFNLSASSFSSFNFGFRFLLSK